MAFSSDEDSELTLMPDSVTNYHFVTDSDEPISFSALPSSESAEVEVYLYGTTEDGLQKVYQPVIEWKLELELRTGPEIFVKSKDGKWVKLLKPRKIYEGMIRSVLITIQMLHFVKWNSSAVDKSLWDHLRRVFDKFERRPSEEDLLPHFSFIKQFSEQDEALGKSQLLKDLLERKGRRRTGEGNSRAEVKEPFIAGDDEELTLDDKKGNESDEEKDLFDSCCCVCDNGGDLLCCEGECMRSFHATKEAGEESACRSLGMTKSQVDAIQNFLCKNCQVKQHQCFACGKLGNSDKSKGAEVFQCSNATCGYFYHPSCVAKLLHPDDESKASECETDVVNGKFVCPAHRCYVCKKLEVKKDYELNFAVCRRCPKSYHRKCLPRKIAVEKDAKARGIITRAWEYLLPNRLLIYCLKHKIEEGLGTPIRNHIKFPVSLENKEKNKEKETEINKNNKRALEKRKRPIETEDSPSERGPIKKRPFETEQKGLKKKNPVLNPNEQQNKRIVKKKAQVEVKKGEGSTRQVAAPDLPKASSPRMIVKTAFPVISAETEKKIRALYERESAKVTMKDVLKKQTVPLTHQNTVRQIEKVARGKIEGSVEAIQAAYERITEGKSVDDVKALCEPEVVKQVAKWNKRLGVYLSPFLHGMRYTSFGRHFTKEEKLEEIVNKLQWYVQTDDTIVDFCCGSNDFSRLMKQKMDTMGKKCNFKNYDIMWPQDDFCFEKRDWMTVQPKELPSGSSLIMGLNPPFGSKAALANKFIDKALTFKPKLIILIVPKETERLDKKRLGSTRYELIWEDNITLSGKSFYLPGSVDEKDNQMDQWNVSSPVLYLWSRLDWAGPHRALAEEHAHFSLYSDSSSSYHQQNGILLEQNGILLEENGILGEEEMELDEREAGDIISQVVGDIINVRVEGGNNERVVGDDDGKDEREERREKRKKKGEEREREGEGMVGGSVEGEGERLSEERERGHEEGEEDQRRLAEERERESEARKRDEEKERVEAERKLAEEKEAERGAQEKEREKEARRRAEAKRRAEEKEREEEAKRKLAEKREKEKEAKRKLAEEKEREKEAKRKLAEEKEREKEAKRRAEEREEAKRKLAEEKEAERKLAEEREREKEAERKLAEERERKKEAERKLAEERERELEAKMRAEEREEEKKRLTEQREKEIEARRQRIAEEREAQRIERERENEAKRRAEEEKLREAQRRLYLERERESGPHFNRRRSSPTSSRERDGLIRSPSGSRERGSTAPSGPRERNNRPSDPRRRTDPYSDMEISPVRNNNTTITKHSSQNQPTETRHLDTTTTTNLLMESEPIETRHLSILPPQSQDDFLDLGPLFNNNNEDIDEIAKRYSSGPNPSFNWNSIGSGFRSGPASDYNRIHGSDFLIDNNNRGLDDFNNPFNNNPYLLGPIGPMSPIRSIHGNNSSTSYLSGFGCTGTSGSVTDRYAPRLDETNFFNRPGPPPVQGQFGNYGYGGLSGYEDVGAVRREMPPPQSDQLGFRSDQLGFQARNPYRPPPGSSGGWIND